jgi:hypothetical protein
MRRNVYRPRLVRVRFPASQVQALAFIADPKRAGYAGRLPIDQNGPAHHQLSRRARRES